ncbi:MAG: fasciclin domain-containing protein [Longimicrobiales bacterium]
MNRRMLLRCSLLALAPFGALACGDDTPTEMMDPAPVDLVATAEGAGTFTTLVAALEATDLRTTLETGGPFTVFAPTDAAFAALPAGTLDALLADPPALAEILLYHVVDGDLASTDVAAATLIPTLNGQAMTVDGTSGLTVDGAAIVTADIAASNGTIHVIDAVILPSTDDIVDIAVGDAAFSTLVSALGLADLVTTLQGDGPFTVFAPTDAAFSNIPSDDLDAILADTDLLTEVLTYHVVSGRVLSTDVVGLSSATTLNGEDVTITVDGGTVMIDGATVTATDVQGTNGVVHIIDQVLLPPGFVIP